MIFGLTHAQLAWAAVSVVGSAVVSLAVVVAFVVQLRSDHFIRREGSTDERRPVALRALATMARNVIGLLLVVVGILLSLPGVPGQGLLTIFVGLLLLDWPGKRRLLLRLVRRKRLRNAIDRLRARFDRPPLELEAPEDGEGTA